MKQYLILVHRYLGIPLSFLFVLWFISGIAMIYVGGMPQLAPQARLEHLPVLDVAEVKLSPREAAERVGATAAFGHAVLLTVMDRPAYRFRAPPFAATTVFADDGEVLGEIDVSRAQTVASRFLNLPEQRIEFQRTVYEPDQWTLVLGRELPLYKFRVDDEADTELYVSPSLAEVVLATTARTRALAWSATIPHWLYFTPLRVNQPLWYWTVVVAAGLGCVLAAIGLTLGVTQFRKSKPFRLAASIRYVGFLRWHYVLGVVFGLFALTWVFSGLLSMEPFAWTTAEGLDVPRDVMTGGPLELERFAAVTRLSSAPSPAGRALKELELARIHDEPYFIARYSVARADGKRERLHQPYGIAGRAEPDYRLIAADTLAPRDEPFSVDSVLARLRSAALGATIVDAELLSDYDAYYYSRGRQAPLPVLRVKFDDPLETWVYVDLERSEVLAEIHRLNRLERWLYNGLHSLDFGFWYDRRPLWDVGVIVLCVGALATSLIGAWLGLKRVRRDAARLGGRS